MENLLINRRELDFVKHNFYKNVYNEFGIEHINFEVNNWEELNWEEFKSKLLKLGAKFEPDKELEWKNYFSNQKLKLDEIKQRMDEGSKKKNEKEMVVYV